MLFRLRYHTILKVLRSSGYCPTKHRIAEIGSGVPGLSDYIKGHFIGCYLKFSGAIPSKLNDIRAEYKIYPCENLLLHSVLLRLESTAYFKAVNWWLRKLLFKWIWTLMLPFANFGKTYRRIFAISSRFKT